MTTPEPDGPSARTRAQAPAPSDPDLLARVHAILADTPLIDGHNDLAAQILERADGNPDALDIARPQPQLMTDLPRLRAGQLGAQFWSAYVDVATIQAGTALHEGLRQVDMVRRMVARYADLEMAATADDIVRIHAEGRIASMIGLEGGHAIESSLPALRMFYALGVRYMTLTHNGTTEWADAAMDDARHGGLTPLGVDIVHEMNRIGMFVDLSHVSEGAMNDALDASMAPILFSHSSARALVPVPRNVPDAVLARVPANGGVVMVSFVPPFTSTPALEWENAKLAESKARAAAGLAGKKLEEAMQAWTDAHPAPRATMSQVADHIDHVRGITGIDHIGVGSDFDGIPTVPVGLEDVSKFPNLFAELLHRGYSDEDVRKIAGLNVLRAMRGMEQVAANGGRAVT